MSRESSSVTACLVSWDQHLLFIHYVQGNVNVIFQHLVKLSMS